MASTYIYSMASTYIGTMSSTYIPTSTRIGIDAGDMVEIGQLGQVILLNARL